MKSALKQNMRAVGIAATALFGSVVMDRDRGPAQCSAPTSPGSSSSSRAQQPVQQATPRIKHTIKKLQSDESLKQSAILDDETFGYTNLDSLTLVAGSGSTDLAREISERIGVPLSDTVMKRFLDGEVSVQFNQHIRGRDVFIIQSCAAPVNDSIMELLLTISCARRAGAKRVIAVIPYFGYKHHRRGQQLSTKHQSRFLSSGAMDFSKMLQQMGVDRVLSVDLQRPGQGQEACFFDTSVPLEVLMTMDLTVKHFANNIDLQEPIVIVTPNAECFKKARKFQLGLQKEKPDADIQLGAFFSSESSSGPVDTSMLELVGSSNKENLFKGADVVIVDDMVDSAGTLRDVSAKLESAGARSVYVAASHGLFTDDSMEIIQRCEKLKKVVVTNSLPLPSNSKVSEKVEQISIAKLLSKVILAEYYRHDDVLDGSVKTEVEVAATTEFDDDDTD